MPTSGPTTEREFSVTAVARREWSEAERQRIVDEASVAGANISAVARRNGVAQSLLYRWRKARVPKTDSPAFVPVALALPAPLQPFAPPPAPATSPATSSQIEIEVAGGRKLRVDPGVDIAALKRIVAALESG